MYLIITVTSIIHHLTIISIGLYCNDIVVAFKLEKISFLIALYGEHLNATNEIHQ